MERRKRAEIPQSMVIIKAKKMETAIESNNKGTEKTDWRLVCKVEDVPENEGVCALLDGEQIAIYNFKMAGKWYASQNQCPHKKQEALSRGMLGSHGIEHEAKVACPFHKKTFSLETGKCLVGEEYEIKIYPVKIENDMVYVGMNKV